MLIFFVFGNSISLSSGLTEFYKGSKENSVSESVLMNPPFPAKKKKIIMRRILNY